MGEDDDPIHSIGDEKKNKKGKDAEKKRKGEKSQHSLPVTAYPTE